MIPDPLQMLRNGVVGTFQPLVDPALKKRFAGHLQLGTDGAVIAAVASKKRDQQQRGLTTLRITRSSPASPKLAPSLRPSARSGAARRTATTLSRSCDGASNLLINVPFDEVDADTVTAANVSYLGLGSWSGRPDHVDEPIVEEGVIGWRIEVRSEQQRSVDIDAEYELTVEHDWTLAGPPDNRSLDKPLKIGIRSNKRRPIGEHIVRLDALHALLSVAHRKPVTATSGTAQLDPESRKRALLWDDTMMDHLVERETNEFPIFTLADINDLEGLAAWVTTCLTKRRAVAPIVRHRLFENQTAEARLLYTAAAMEFWVASNARDKNALWARKVRELQVPHAIGDSVSDEWVSWIGDADHWANLFYGTYNQLKHTAMNVDVEVVDALEFSGRWLLTASVLDQCAGSSIPSGRIFTDGLRYPIHQNVRSILDGAPIPNVGNRR